MIVDILHYICYQTTCVVIMLLCVCLYYFAFCTFVYLCCIQISFFFCKDINQTLKMQTVVLFYTTVVNINRALRPPNGQWYMCIG